MSINQQSAFPLLLKAALADSCFKLAESIWQSKSCGISHDQRDESRYLPVKLGTLEEHRFDRNHPYYHACDEARELCTELGRFCRKNNVDLSSSALLKDLSFKAFFLEAYEAGRVVTCDVLTPKVLHDSVEKRNVLLWKGWTITAGREDECDDAYGLPTFTRPLVAKHDGGRGIRAGQGSVHAYNRLTLRW